MHSAQEARPRARSPFVAAFLSFLFPGLGHAYAGAYQRALGFAAAPILLVALTGGIVLRMNKGELAGWLIANLGLILLVNLIVLVYRCVAVIDAWRVTTFINSMRDARGGRLGRPRVPLSSISVAGLAAVLIILAGAHVAVARYDLTAQDLAHCVFDADGTATNCDEGDTSASTAPAGSDLPGDSPDETIDVPSGPVGSALPEGTPLPQWNGKDRLNILLLGIDQRAGQSTFNTDTMIVVSIDPASGQVAMLSLPRDTVGVPVPPGPAQHFWGLTYGNKINSWFQANRKRADLWPGNDRTRGYNALKAILGNLYGIDIRYYVQVNFDGFKKVVDTLGGVTVNVQRPVVDDNYPGDQRLIRVYIPTGVQHMDGSQALIYARSRHGKNGLGSDDYDRGARQQRLIVSLANQTNVAALLPKVNDLAAALKKAVQTDIPLDVLPNMLGLADKVDTKNIRSYVFAPPLYGSGGYFNGTFKLVPNVPRIRQAARDAFTVDPKAEATRRSIAEEAATVWVLNGSGITGQASDLVAFLNYEGMLASAPNQRPPSTPGRTRIVAYNGAETASPDTAKFLADTFDATIETATDPSARADFVITTARSTPSLTPPPAA